LIHIFSQQKTDFLSSDAMAQRHQNPEQIVRLFLHIAWHTSYTKINAASF
jgi:hypothetical protein